jgi:hypothetical protein
VLVAAHLGGPATALAGGAAARAERGVGGDRPFALTAGWSQLGTAAAAEPVVLGGGPTAPCAGSGNDALLATSHPVKGSQPTYGHRCQELSCWLADSPFRRVVGRVGRGEIHS